MKAKSVLLADTNPTDRSVLHQLCLHSGLQQVTETGNGPAALAMLSQQPNPFDLLICELDLPELDGIELIRSLAADQINIALIIISSKAAVLLSAVEQMAKANGMQVLAALTKPVQPDQLLAALALYQADHSQTTATQPPQSPAAYSISTLKSCLQHNRIVLHYQPKVSMQTRALVGVEAMARLQLATGELIYPDQFIAQCEEFHLIDQLSYQLVQQAALQQKIWAESGFSTTVSVNLSATSFNSAAFGQQMIQLLSAAEIDLSTLVFEVTESAVIRSTATALYILSRFRLLGAGLSIDNYGTGYSTIKHLSQYPYSELKVDRSLIRNIAVQPHMQVIFESILQMCKRLQIELVAEGVETQADWDYLQQSGCPVAQGYLIAPPMPAQQLQSWWQQGKYNGRNPISF